MSFKPYLDQDYESIKRDCQRSNRLFEDEKFPADQSSLSRNNPTKFKGNINWKRASEIVDNPKFIVNNVTPDDLDQGTLGNCWLISAMAAIATVPEYLNVVIPSDQSFDSKDYAGVFHFRFWRFGQWYDVVIDDRLPVDEKNGSLIYCHNNHDQNEMFGPLMEKAYAKLNLCYGYLDGGEVFDAMIDLTGGVHEAFTVKYQPPAPKKGDDDVDSGVKSLEPDKLWDTIYKSYCMKSLSGASIDTKGKSKEEIASNKLVAGHAYCILSVHEILPNGNLRDGLNENSDSQSTRLLRMRNPWGQKMSWNGRWSTNSREWDNLSDDIKSQLNANNQTDGEFFICFEDFIQCFDEIDFVHVNLNAFYDGDSSVSDFKWQCQSIAGEFVPGKNAGGCGNDDQQAFWLNPQYPIQIVNSHTSIIVSFIQCEQNRLKDQTDGSYEKSNEALGFSIYKYVGDLAKLGQGKNFDNHDLVEKCSSGDYVYQREVSRRFHLEPANYFIIPSLFQKDKPMKFLLRIFTQGTSTQATNVRVGGGGIQNNNSSPIKQKSNDDNDDVATDNNSRSRRDDDRRNDDDDDSRERHHHHHHHDDDDNDGGRDNRDERRGGRKRRTYNTPQISISDVANKVVSKACLIM